jgi:hypothetical protein
MQYIFSGYVYDLKIDCSPLSKYLGQVIDIFVSKDPDISDYRLTAEDWMQIKVFAKILEACFFLWPITL